MIEPESQIHRRLRSLATELPREAPGAVQAALLSEFRRHHARRRQRRTVSWAVALAACLFVAAAISLLPLHSRRDLHPVRQTAMVAGGQHSQAAQQSSAASDDFILLPYADASLDVGQTVVARVQMSAADLGLLGLPVTQQSNATITADVALGEDGLPYAIHFVEP